jgi:AcrR family transcriptional regulator
VTGSPDWRAQRWAATHQRIYDAALELFQRHGFEQVSVGQIVREAGVTAPTFYAHYPSKEHLVMQLPTAEEITGLVAALPADLPLRDRLRYAAPVWVASWSPEVREATLARWRVIAGEPSLRTRAAEYERVTAGLIAQALAAEAGGSIPQADAVVVNAYMATFTSAVLAWADCDGERKIEELVDEAFGAL